MLPSTVRYGQIKNGTYSIKDYIKYKYDSMGNICEVLENGLIVAKYEYDMLGRLIREDNRKFARTSIYTYDNNGNILSRFEYNLTNVQTDELKLTIPREMFVYEYDGDNTDKLICYAGAGFTYDSIGNPTTYRGRAATWINGRQLASYDGNTYTYDARGRRVSKRKGNNTAINFTYDSNGNLVSQSNGLEFLYDHTGVFAVIFNGATYFYRKNAQGDIIAILDNEGRVVVKYTYNAWGNTVTEVLDCNANAIAELNPFRYRGYYYDIETELYFLKSRYYDPELGRFMTIDDVSYLDPDTINGLNLYAYCGNNPIANVDYSGNEWWNPRTWSNEAKKIAGAVCTVLAITGVVAAGVALLGAGTATVAGAAIGGIVAGGLEIGVQICTNGALGINNASVAIEALTGSVYGAVSGVLSVTQSVKVALTMRTATIGVGVVNTLLHGINARSTGEQLIKDCAKSLGVGIIVQVGFGSLDFATGKLTQSIRDMYLLDGALEFSTKAISIIFGALIFKNAWRNRNKFTD